MKILKQYCDIGVSDWWPDAATEIGGAIFVNSPSDENLMMSAARLKHAIIDAKEAEWNVMKSLGLVTNDEKEDFMAIGPADVLNAYRDNPWLCVARQTAKTREGRRWAFLRLLDDSRMKSIGERFKCDFKKVVNDALWRI